MDVWIIAAAAGAGYVAQRFKKLTKVQCSETVGGEECRERGRDFLDYYPLEMASTSGSQGGNMAFLDEYESSNDGDTKGDEGGTSNPIEVSYGIRRNRNGLRSRRVDSRFLRPRNSLESCLMAQLYKENAQVEKYTYSAPTSIVRPFLVCDRSRIISRGPHQICSSRQTGTWNYELQKDKTAHCVPRLPVELQTKAEAKTGKEQVFSKGGSSSDGALLFYLGLTMGIAYSSLQHKLEMENLRKSLKHAEDLVQDLQEELEMRDASTVKELAVEDYKESLDVNNDSYFNNDVMRAISPEQKSDTSPRQSEEESMKKIEAELEAELDMLESNMNSCRFEGKPSDTAELRADLFGAKNRTQQTYAVSPIELTLRLHELIQSRLEERIRELETALEQSQTKIKCNTDSPNLKTGYSSNHEISADQPVVINLSGEALSAYNEAYEEMTRLSESDEGESEGVTDFDFSLLDSYAEQRLILEGSPETGFSSHMNLSSDVMCDSSEDGEDEMERMLIKQIVEKARQGSPAVLKVQKALLSGDESTTW